MSATAPLRVGVDARSLYAADRRGIGKTLLLLYKEMIAQSPDWEFFFYFERQSQAYSPWGTLPSNVHERPLPGVGYRFGLWARAWLPLRATFDRIDVLHCPAQFAPPRSPAPVVLTVHDVIPIVCEGEVTVSQARRFRAALGRSVGRARHVIAISQHSLADLRREIPEARERDCSVIHWGLTTAPCPPANKSLGEYSFTMLAFGGDAHRKNIPRLLQAFQLAQVSNPGWRLVVTGLPEETRSELGVVLALKESALELRGYVAEEELQGLLREAEAFVFPSLYEGFGIPLLEAMAAGTPVLAANNSSVPEVAGDAADYFDGNSVESMAEVMSRFMQSSADQKRAMALRGCERIRQFSINKTAEQTREILQTASSRPY